MKIDLHVVAPGTWFAERMGVAVTHDDLSMYANASGDLNPLHLDPSFAREAGFDDVIVHGMYAMAQVGRLLVEHFEMDDIRTFSARFNAVIPVGSRIHSRARLIERSESEATVALEASVQGRGPESTVAISGTATIALRRVE